MRRQAAVQQPAHISLHVFGHGQGRLHHLALGQKMGLLQLRNGATLTDLVGPPHLTAARQGLHDPEGVLRRRQRPLACQPRRHQGEAADAVERAVELLGQCARHHHRQAGACEATGPRGHRQAHDRGPLIRRQQLLHSSRKTIGEFAPSGAGQHPAAALRIIEIEHRHPQHGGGTVQSQQPTAHRGSSTPGRRRCQRPGSASKLAQLRTSHSIPA